MPDLDPLQIRAILGRRVWGPPKDFPGSLFPGAPRSGWTFQGPDRSVVIVSVAPHPFTPKGVAVDPSTPEDQPDITVWIPWIHASISRGSAETTYADLELLRRAVFADGFSYQTFAPPDQHVNIHANAYHLWGRADGLPIAPLAGLVGGKLSV